MSARHLTGFACLIALLAVWAPPAGAAFGLKEADVQFSEEDGSPATLAGSHPFSMSTTIAMNTVVEGATESPEEALKDLEVKLPEGFVGIPTATARCSAADFADLDKSLEPPLPNCPDESAVGYAIVAAAFNPFPVGGAEGGAVPLYNLEPAPGSVAKFGFVFISVPVTLEVKVSEELPHRVVALVRNAAQPLLFYGSTLTLWGNPNSPVFDPIRGHCLAGRDSSGLLSRGNCPVPLGTPELPLLTAPRACEGPLSSNFTAASWQQPGIFVSRTSESALEFEGCEELEFTPEATLGLSEKGAARPTGLDFEMDIEDEGIVSTVKRAQSDVKRIRVELPAGVTLNPSAADGMAGCSTAQLEAETLDSVPGEHCPAASKIGDVSVTSPLVDEDLDGAIFVATSDDPTTAARGAENPLDSFLATYMVLRNRNLGVIVKQSGKIDANPVTGQLTAIFDELPQLPFGHLEAHFRDGPRAPLVTPFKCGAHVARIEETPWANPAGSLVESVPFEFEGPCPAADPGPFAPSFSAGTAQSAAGSHSPFSIHLSRGDGEAELTRLSIQLPPGLTGKLAGIVRCSEGAIAVARGKTGRQELANPSCPASSQVGHLLAGAGIGSSLTYVPGKLYLAGPYGGAPFSVVVVTPAVAGPFDAGNVVLRQALQLDPSTARVTIDAANSDPIPRILKGVPLRLRDLRLFVDRPNFILNPTNCEPSAITAGTTGVGPELPGVGEVFSTRTARFQASNCAALSFKPKLALSLKGKTTRGGHPALRATMTARPGDANIGRVSVVMPPSAFIDQAHISNPCTRVQFAVGQCPPGSVLGRARAVTPLLDQPLEGPVYFRSNGGERDLPDIVVDLNGEAHITLVGFIDSVQRKGIGRIRTIFQTVPDAPVTKFVLALKGGRRGLLQNSRNLCAGKQVARVQMNAQNGRRKTSRQPIKIVGCRKAKR